MQFEGLISSMLETSIEKLKTDLKPIEQQMLSTKEGMFISYEKDPIPRIVVYASRRFKAYIPKKYDGWDIHYIEWDGSEPDLDLDLVIPC